MPKKVIEHKQGTRIDPALRTFLEQYFNAKNLIKLEQKGGRVVIGLTAPLPVKADKSLIIDTQFIDKIKSASRNLDEITTALSTLSAKQLVQVCNELKIPVRGNATRDDTRSAIIQFLKSESIWKQMIGGGD